MRGSTFVDFSSELYCSGAEEGRCARDGQRELPGQCYWLKQQPNATNATLAGGWARVSKRDVTSVRVANKGRDVFAWQRFDPTDAVPGYVHFSAPQAASCMRGRRVLLLGDSTTRDTFYELLAVLGHPIFSWWPRNRKGVAPPLSTTWPARSFAPLTRMVSSGNDVTDKGRCLSRDDTREACVRRLRINATATEWPARRGAPLSEMIDVGFMFLTHPDGWQLSVLRERLLLPAEPFDAVFLQCPEKRWLAPNAYNYTLSREERHAPASPLDDPSRLGDACLQVARVVLAHSPNARLHLLGPSGHGPHAEWPRSTFRSIHAALGIRCDAASAGNGTSSRGYRLRLTDLPIVPIDRMNVWGPRKPDSIHAYFTAQLALVELMLNHLCTR